MICYKKKLENVLLHSKKTLVAIECEHRLFIAPIIPVDNFDKKLKKLTDVIDNRIKMNAIHIDKYEPAPAFFRIPSIEQKKAKKYYHAQFNAIFDILELKDDLMAELLNNMNSAEDVLLTAAALKYLNKVHLANLNIIKDVIQPYRKFLSQSQKRMLETNNF